MNTELCHKVFLKLHPNLNPNDYWFMLDPSSSLVSVYEEGLYIQNVFFTFDFDGALLADRLGLLPPIRPLVASISDECKKGKG